MPQNTKKSKSEVPIITSPDDVKIQITAGRKLKFIRHVMQNTKRTALQKNVLAILIDRTNEGFGDDTSKHGLAFPSLLTLTDDVGASYSGVRKILDQLIELGDIRKIGEKEKRGGKDDVNHYWLSGWNEFGAVAANRPLSSLLENETGHSVTANRPLGSNQQATQEPVNRPLSGPDSTHILNSETHLIDSNACGGGPAVSSKPEGANDNQPSSWPDDAWKKFWEYWPNQIDPKNARIEFERIRSTGDVDWKEIMRGVKTYKDTKPDHRDWMSPVTFLANERWKDKPGKPPVKQNERRPAI